MRESDFLRVFPRKTAATPRDLNVRFGPPGLFDHAEEIHVSVTFTEDIDKGRWLADQWDRIGDVTLGGPAFDDPGDEFTPGRYLGDGYTFTSRGCPNHCWFCKTPEREGRIRELEIHPGWNILDSNLLACSKEHQQKVFTMLLEQPEKPRFTGGLEAARLTDWVCEWLTKLKPESMWFAYDGPEDRDPLHAASSLLHAHGIITPRKRVRCYVLVGYEHDGYVDTMTAAETRLREARDLGFVPMAMLYRDGSTEPDREWKKFQRLWSRPSISESM